MSLNTFNNLSARRLLMDVDRWEQAKNAVASSGIEHDIYINVSESYLTETEVIAFMIPKFFVGNFPVTTWGLAFIHDEDNKEVRAWIGERVSFLPTPCYSSSKKVPPPIIQYKILRNFRRGFFKAAIRAAREWAESTSLHGLMGYARPGMVMCESCKSSSDSQCRSCSMHICSNCCKKSHLDGTPHCDDHIKTILVDDKEYLVSIRQDTRAKANGWGFYLDTDNRLRYSSACSGCKVLTPRNKLSMSNRCGSCQKELAEERRSYYERQNSE